MPFQVSSNSFTHRGSTRIPEFSVFGEGGSFSTGRGGAQLSGLLGKFDYSAAASYMETDGQGPNDDFLNRTLSGNFGYTFSDTNQLRLTIRNNDQRRRHSRTNRLRHRRVSINVTVSMFSVPVPAGISPPASTGITKSAAANPTLASLSDNPLQSFYATDPNPFCPQTNPTAVATAEFCDFVGEQPISLQPGERQRPNKLRALQLCRYSRLPI